MPEGYITLSFQRLSVLKRFRILFCEKKINYAGCNPNGIFPNKR